MPEKIAIGIFIAFGAAVILACFLDIWEEKEMIEFLTICNTAMTFGILVGVWVGVLRTDSELKETLNKINRFLRDKIDGLTGDK